MFRSPRLLSLAILLIAASASASTSVFGPKSYSMTAGKPATVVETIAALAPPECGDRHAYTLTVRNGADAPPVSSASIVLDGAEIIAERDLRSIPETIERTITLGSASVLSVKVNGGQQGAALSVTITADVEETLAPPMRFELAGKEQHFENSIAADGNGPFSITVQNQGAKRGVVTVNGTTLFIDASTTFVRRLITLAATNVVTADLRGDAQDAVAVTFARILNESSCGPTVAFTSPEDHATAATDNLLVRGVATGDSSIGVTVNGYGADIDLSHAGTASDPYTWAAALPVEPGELQLTARATIASQKSSEASRTVVVGEPPQDGLTFRVDPSTGVAPLRFGATVMVDDPSLVALWELDLDGDGTYETSSATRPRDVRATHALPGMRTIHARVTLTDGTTREASAVITTVSFTTMDTLLRATWSRFTSALAARDVDAALAELADDRARAYYGDGLRLIQPTLSDFAQGLATLWAVRLSSETAHYLLVRNENGVDRGYHIYFVRSADGVWRISQF